MNLTRIFAVATVQTSAFWQQVHSDSKDFGWIDFGWKGRHLVRLDEWQKYIEGQFLDDTTEDLIQLVNGQAKVDTGYAVVAEREHPPHPGLAPIETTESEDEVSVTPAQQTDLPQHPDALDLADPNVGLGGIEQQQTSVAAMPPVNTQRLVLESSSLYGEVPDPGITLPEFDSYLPASHRAGRLVIESLPVAPTMEQVLMEGAPRTQEAEPSAVPNQQRQEVQDTTMPAPTAPSEVQPTSETTRRAARTRARHARNVRPEHVPSGLSAGELWATVPKHVQTLLSLERLEEEHEVAQFSYKRPFQEKRRELIERLLDPILSLEDTARLLNVCPTTVRRYTNKGILTYYRKEPDRPDRADATNGDAGKETRQRRFRLSDILAFLETQQAALTANGQRDNTESAQMRDRRIHSAQSRQIAAAAASDIDNAATMQPTKD